MQALLEPVLDEGSEHFDASNLEITSLETGNRAVNVIPNEVIIRFNIRFNDLWSAESLHQEIMARLEKVDIGTTTFELTQIQRVSHVFRTEPGPFIDHLVAAIADITGQAPKLSTSGGTSDARFIKDYCDVVEFGLVGQTMHKIDECASVEDLNQLTEIYHRFLERFFGLA